MLPRSLGRLRKYTIKSGDTVLIFATSVYFISPPQYGVHTFHSAMAIMHVMSGVATTLIVKNAAHMYRNTSVNVIYLVQTRT